MATHLFVHAQKPKSRDLEVIKGSQVTKTFHFCYNSSTSNIQKSCNNKSLPCQPKEKISISCCKYYVHTPMGMSPLTSGIQQVPLDTCQMIMTTGSRYSQQVQPTLNPTSIWNSLDLTKGYVSLIGDYIDFVLVDISRSWTNTTMTRYNGRRRLERS